MVTYNKLFKILDERNLTLEDLKLMCGWKTNNQISRLKHGTTITTITIEDLCIALKVKPNDILEIK